MPSWLASSFDLPASGLAVPLLSLQAYLDPGMGSYALQIILASLFGGMFALKQWWEQIKGWFLGRFGGRSGPSGGPRDRERHPILNEENARPRAHGQSTV